MEREARQAARPLERKHTYLAENIYYLVLENQLPHKIVNLLFTITN